ncbi:MAG TPA: adenylate/guanylate cyclase domain-containing protein [Rhizomicrobium sp.]|nr:adenylate/guanylate cyclase domain-containing protein [Rhizomicrobium sp.]
MNPFAALSRWIRGSAIGSTITLFAISIPVAYLVTWAVHNSLLDRGQRNWVISTATPAQEQDPDIVVVTIDEDFIDHFGTTARYRYPVDRHEIANLLQTIADKHPRAIGLDILLDRRTEPAKDDELRAKLGQLSNTYTNRTKIFIAEKSDENDSETQTLKYFLFDQRSRAVRDVCIDNNAGTVTAAVQGHNDEDGDYMPSFSQALAEAGGTDAAAQTTTALNCSKQSTGVSALELAWHGTEPANQHYFRQYPARFVEQLPAEWFAGKIVLVGMEVPGIDRLRAPFTSLLRDQEGGVPDVVVQAHAVSQLLRNRPPPSMNGTVDLLLAFALAFLGALNGAGSRGLGIRAVMGIVALGALWVGGVALYYFSGHLVGLVAPSIAAVVSFAAMDTLSGSQARKQRAFIQRAFESYVPPKLVDRLVREPERMSLDGELRTMSFIFTDVKDFTTMVESLKDDPGKLPPMLNAYLDGIARIVVKHDGMIDKFIGDAVFAIFNAPIDLPDFAEKAARCALEIDEFGEKFRQEQEAKGIRFGMTRIGVHTGSAIIGNFGGRARFTYTAAGDAVNTAARLEGLNKRLGTRICASGETRARCKSILFRPVATAMVKGKSESVEVWQPLHDGEYSADYLRRYEAAFAKVKAGTSDAMSTLNALQAEDPKDPLVRMYVERLKAGQTGITIGLD